MPASIGLESFKPRKAALFAAIAVMAFSGMAQSAPATFDFKDPKGVNHAVFRVDAPLEAISGTASGVSGTVTFDPQDPGTTRGKIAVSSKSLTVPHPVMNGHLHGDDWLDVAKYPEIVFDVRTLKNVKTTGDTTTADAVGTFKLKDVTREMTVPVKLTYLKDKLGDRVPKLKGDLLVIRSNFTINRSDFNIMPNQGEDKVSDMIEITLGIAGAAAK